MSLGTFSNVLLWLMIHLLFCYESGNNVLRRVNKALTVLVCWLFHKNKVTKNPYTCTTSTTILQKDG